MVSSSYPPSTRLNVVSWNMLLDVTRTKNKQIRPQHDRLPGFVATLQHFHGQLDYVGVQEAAAENGSNNGESLAETLGFPVNFFEQHNYPHPDYPGIGRRNEYLGAFGTQVDNTRLIDIGHQRGALVTTVGSLALINTHFRARARYAAARLENAEKLIEQTEQYDHAVITIDTNERKNKPARKLLRAAGYHSVFEMLGEPHPATFATPDYRNIMYGVPFGHNLPAVNIDDILVRGSGISVANAGIITEQVVALPPVVDDDGIEHKVPDGASDHYGLWATLDVDSELL